METRKLKTSSRDPFAVDPLPKAYYYPSPEKQLSKREKATALSFTCEEDVWDKESAESPADRPVKVSALDELFLKGTNYFRSKSHDWPAWPEDDQQLDESWPASERPSSISLNGLEDESLLDLENYQLTVDRFTKPKAGDRDQISDPVSEYKQRSRQGQRAAVLGKGVGERRRMPGTAVQASGATGQTGKSRLPVKQSKPSITKQLAKGVGATRKKENVPPIQEEDGSVLQKYIDRFRNSAPMSREERQRKTDDGSKDFWWLKDKDGTAPYPEDSFNQTDSEPGASERVGRGHVTSRGCEREGKETRSGGSQLTMANMEKYRRLHEAQNLPYGVTESPSDKRTLELQKRAEQLLEKSLSSVASTEPAVSTEGLGSNLSDISGLEDYTYRPKFAPYLEPDVPRIQGLPKPLPGQRAPPDDDPLQQWRLRRKMETAQQGHGAPVQEFNFLSKTEQQKKIDAKLEEFKQRLAGKGPSNARVSTSNVQFTPAPSHHMGPLHIQTHDDSDSVQPQIASPSLKPCRPRTDPNSEVDPHLHLMCDLLPCPHRGEYRETPGKSTELGTRLESRGGDSNVKSKKSSKRGDSNVHSKFSPRGDNFCDNKNKLDDSEQQHYKQFLPAEKPDVDSQQSHSDISENMDTEQHSKHDKHGDLEKMVQDIMINKDKYIDPRDSVDQPFANNEKSRANEQKDQRTDINKVKTDRDETCDKSKGKEPKERHERSKETERDRHRDDNETDESRVKVIKPKHSSSPTLERKGINAAIGQVIKEHLFSTSTSTVLSSVESLPPAASHERLTARKPGLPAHPESSSHTDEEADSDGEFPSDELLVMLRQQRSTYERQIQQIDKLLENLER